MFDFDGIDDLIDFGTPAGLNTLGASSYACLIGPDSVGETGGRIIEKGNDRIFVSADDPVARIAVEFAHATASVRRSTEDGSITYDGALRRLLVTWDGSLNATGINIFLDGIEAAYSLPEDGSGARTNNDASPFTVGNNSAGSRSFDGRIAEVAVWNRVLSAGERSGLAKGYSALHYLRGLMSAPGLIRNPTCPITGVSGTLTGTTVVAHPRIIYPKRRRLWSVPAAWAGTASLTGTAMASITEADVVAGGKTIIATLSGGETFIPN